VYQTLQEYGAWGDPNKHEESVSVVIPVREAEQEDKQGRRPQKKEQTPTHPKDVRLLSCLSHATNYQLPKHPVSHIHQPFQINLHHLLLPPPKPQPIPLIQRLRLAKQNLRRQIASLTQFPIILEQQMA
jgi:hypothetical protein